MKIAPDLESYTLFLVLVVPGLISMHVYRLLFAAREIDWKGGLIQALFYSSLNLAVCLPILVPIHRGDFLEKHPYWYTAGLMVVLLAIPAAWPFLFQRLLRWQWLASKIQLPYPTAWDWFFERRERVFVLVQLRNGSRIGGYYGFQSYATSFPTEGEIYLEAVYRVDEDGKFKEPMSGSRGAIIRKDQYDLIEFFTLPEEWHNGKESSEYNDLDATR